MLKHIYIETTIPSFYYTSRTDTQSRARSEWTREWWEKYANKYELASSTAVIEELQQGISKHTEERLNLLYNVTLLEINKEIIDIAQIYIDHLVWNIYAE